jgi:cytochrome c-type biogenesis protein CcmH
VLEFLLALLTTATVGALLWPLLKTRVDHRDRLSGELAIYRDQLAELEREQAAGRVSGADGAAARVEIERRILAAGTAAETLRPSSASPLLHKLLPPALCLLVPMLALGIYLQMGRPGLPAAPFDRTEVADQGPAGRPLDVARLLADARAKLAQDPDDPEALAALGEGLTLEADGTVTQPAVQAFNRALQKTPDDPRVQYYLGLHEAQSGDSRAAIARWQALEAKSPPDAPWLGLLRAEIARVAKSAGIAVAAPPAPPPQSSMPQPSREQQDAMANMAPAEREQAIRSMVEGLAARLEQNPQDRAGWLRLANAWKVLGDNPRAADAYRRADTLAPVDTRLLTDWAEAHVRQITPGTAPSPEAVRVLERLEKAEPRNALALFYLGAASVAAGDKPAALRRWQTLLALLPADAPIRPMLEDRIKELEK